MLDKAISLSGHGIQPWCRGPGYELGEAVDTCGGLCPESVEEQAATRSAAKTMTVLIPLLHVRSMCGVNGSPTSEGTEPEPAHSRCTPRYVQATN
jgi:hypothetical protein